MKTNPYLRAVNRQPRRSVGVIIAAVLSVALVAGLLVWAAVAGPTCAEYRTHWVSGVHFVNGRPHHYSGSETYCARWEDSK
ncbi:hypothetical protein [Streptomyces cylindrosporus]|uniref:Uncharacterized protein n=1 Tax=Streptomyces cylindrosporus TaxID=2927583 RepID=A0ABS9Y1G7_9ACTN|nr:hypothetical protein [Streptomyces cylindrosporus]MCI3271042.1 hypothetical protein [Streptomyces cylindrosporus]